MRSEIRRCSSCGRYTLRDVCPSCGEHSVCPVPPRYSPEDRMGKYRRISVMQEMERHARVRHLRAQARFP